MPLSRCDSKAERVESGPWPWRPSALAGEFHHNADAGRHRRWYYEEGAGGVARVPAACSIEVWRRDESKMRRPGNNDASISNLIINERWYSILSSYRHMFILLLPYNTAMLLSGSARCERDGVSSTSSTSTASSAETGWIALLPSSTMESSSGLSPVWRSQWSAIIILPQSQDHTTSRAPMMSRPWSRSRWSMILKISYGGKTGKFDSVNV